MMGEKPSFFSELKRRNVYKVAVAYAIVGWLVIQITSTVLPTFHAPEWVVQTLMVLVALGFPIALVLAWAFELTPEGIKRTEDVAPNESITFRTGRKLVGITIAMALIAAGLMTFKVLRPKPGTMAAAATSSAPVLPVIAAKSIAVLPLVNTSGDPANEYFSDGLSEELIAVLAKIPGLKIIGRSSSFPLQRQVRGQPDHWRQAGRGEFA